MGDFCWQKREGHTSFTDEWTGTPNKALKDRMKWRESWTGGMPATRETSGPERVALTTHVSDGRDSGALRAPAD
jgi:hypothetical protein